MNRLFAVGLIGLLAACGAEGDPLRPTANLGVNFGPSGVSQSVAIGASNSNVSFSVGASG